MRTKPVAAALLILLVALLSTGCSRSYNKKWEAAVAAKADGLEGPWEGYWKSNVNGHTGKLRCIVTARGEDRYHFHWWASWGKLSGDYEIESMSKPEGARHQLVMDFDLGKLGGVYRLEGISTKINFRATYDSKGDRGVLVMKRPTTPSATP